MSQSRTIATNIVVLAAAKLIDRGITTFLAFFVARKLGAGALGIYTAATVYLASILAAASMGATSYVIREIAKAPKQTSRFVIHLSVLVTAASGLGVSASFLIIPHLGYSAAMSHAVYLVLFAVLPTAMGSILEAAFVAHQRVKFITYTSVISAIANGAIALWMLDHGFGVVSLVAAFVIVQYLEMVCYFVFLSRYVEPLHWEFSFSEVRRVFSDIKPFAGTSILTAFLSRPEILFLSFMTSEVQLGYYSAAFKLVDLWSLVPQMYMTNVFPLMSRTYETARGQFDLIRDKSIKYLLAISLPLAVGMFVAAPHVVYLVYGRGFAGAVPLVRLLAWTIPLSALFSVTWRVLTARGEQGRVMNLQLIVSVVRVTAGPLLIYWMAARGGAIAVGVSLVLHNLLLLYYVQRKGTRIPLFSLCWRFGLASVIVGLASAMALTRFHFMLVGLIAGVAYFAVVLSMEAFSADDIALFREIVARKTTASTVSSGAASEKGEDRREPAVLRRAG